MGLEDLGWNDSLRAAFEPFAREGLVPGRVVAQLGLYRVAAEAGEFLAETAGRLRHAEEAGGLPAVGDWVAARPPTGTGTGMIHGVLPRRSKFSRKAAGSRTEEQVVAANVDIVFLVSGLDADFSPRRIERYLSAAWESGAEPVVVLNKADRCADPAEVAERVRAVEEIALGVPVVATSAKAGEGLDQLRAWLAPGRTVALLGSSGVGKSTLTNRLLGREAQRTAEVREGDDRGRHVTRHRELFRSPEGWLLLDTPGMREIQLWESDEGVESTFSDIEEIAQGCRFRDCRHEAEPGCAVRAAVEAGRLSAGRLEGWHKLQRESKSLHARQDELARLKEKQRSKTIHKALRDFKPRG